RHRPCRSNVYLTTTSSCYPTSDHSLSLSVMVRDGLQGGEGVERLEPFLATMARPADAAEGQLYPARRAVVVDEDLSGPQPLGQPHLPPAVGGPDARDEAVVGAVGDGDGFVLRFERDDDDGWAEDFLLRQRMIRR